MECQDLSRGRRLASGRRPGPAEGEGGQGPHPALLHVQGHIPVRPSVRPDGPPGAERGLRPGRRGALHGADDSPGTSSRINTNIGLAKLSIIPQGWSSAYTIEAVIMQIAATLVKGKARIKFDAPKVIKIQTFVIFNSLSFAGYLQSGQSATVLQVSCAHSREKW